MTRRFRESPKNHGKIDHRDKAACKGKEAMIGRDEIFVQKDQEDICCRDQPFFAEESEMSFQGMR